MAITRLTLCELGRRGQEENGGWLDRLPRVRDSFNTNLITEETMKDEKKIVTGLGKPELHRVLIRGHDLTKDLVGKITFSDMTYLMLVGRFPSDGERRMTDALLTILVEHGMVSSVISARLCYSTAPEAMQAAVASSILGAGSVHLGSSEWSAKMLVKALPADAKNPDLDAIAASIIDDYGKRKQRIP